MDNKHNPVGLEWVVNYYLSSKNLDINAETNFFLIFANQII